MTYYERRFLLPYANAKNPNEYLIDNKYDVEIEYRRNYLYDIGKCNSYIKFYKYEKMFQTSNCGFHHLFYTFEEAKEKLDEHLINSGYILIPFDKIDYYRLLL
jgi:hypothetical protein